MAVETLRILTRVSVHVDNVTTTYHAGEVVSLDDSALHLVDRGLAIVEVPPPPDPPA